MKYFGTDGIRGKIGEKLSTKTLNKVAKAIILYYKQRTKKVLLVGNDSRLTSDYILMILGSKLLKNGIEIHNVGLCSSPCLAYLTQKFNYPLGLMLSASHNPAEYNGLKFFNSNGEKVTDYFEENFETLMDKKVSLKNNCFSCLKNAEGLKQNYINHLKSHKKFDFPIILDCANGGTSEIVKEVFPKCEKINIKPDGKNINQNSGCTHIETLKSLCVKKQKIGFAFDGDGDRIHIVDIDGTILNGDKILCILSKVFQQSNDICIGTIYTNTALEKLLKERNVALKRSAVGDKNVYALMNETKSNLGGEDSGHIILKPFMNTGDGMLIAILVGNILSICKTTLKELLSSYNEHHQFRENIKIDSSINVNSLMSNPALLLFMKQHENLGAKIIIRPSGTEPVIRLFVEHENKEIANNTIKELHDLILKI